MNWMRRVRGLLRRDELEREFEEEIEFHVAMREQRNAEQGMPDAEARRRARVRFGNPALWRERLREVDLMLWPESVLQDVRFGARMLLRNAGFTAAAILALALGIGLNTTIFTAYKVLLLRGFDARDPRSMVSIVTIREPGKIDRHFSYPDYLAYRDQLHSFSGLAAVSNEYEQLILTGAGGVERQRSGATTSLFQRWGMLPSSPTRSSAELASVSMVSENYFSVLGVAALRGRTFEPEDTARLAASPAVVISENYWQRRFDGDPNIVGKPIRLNGAAFTIMGVTPHDFAGASIGAPDFWFPLSLEALVHPGDHLLSDRDDATSTVIGRLAPGVGLKEAQAEMNLLADRLRPLHDSRSDLSRPGTVVLTPGSELGKIPPAVNFVVFLIMVAAGMVLVTACANVAGLQLARAAARQNELSLRLSLGATRRRLIRQLLTESTLLGLAAGGAALLCTWALVKELAKMAEDTLPADMATFVVHIRPDFAIFAYVFAISLAAGVLFGLAPAVESSHAALSSALRANAATSPMRSRRLRGILIAGQVAICTALLIAGASLVHSTMRALSVETGYDAKQVIDLEVRFPDGPQYTPQRSALLMHELRDRLAGLPGVASISDGRAPDDDNVRWAAIALDGNKPTPSNTRAWLCYTFVQADYFRTLGIPLLFGLGFEPQAGQPEGNVILSESAARQLWPGKNPIGRKLRMGTDRAWRAPGEILPDGPVYEVIGVSRDVRGVLPDGGDSAQVYVPLPESEVQNYPILIRTQGDPGAVMAAIGPAMSSVDPNLPATVSTLEWMLRQTDTFVDASLAASIATLIGVFGLVLASMGIYGTVSYMVALRTREVGIRMALGAKKRDVVGLILRESTRPVVTGLLVGVVLASGVAYLLRHVLYGIHMIDGLSFGGVSLLLLAIALLAALIPSRRAVRVEPMVALRYE